jgi:hypothetical protein
MRKENNLNKLQDTKIKISFELPINLKLIKVEKKIV